MKRVVNISFAAIWVLWIGGGVWAFVAGEPAMLGIVAVPGGSSPDKTALIVRAPADSQAPSATAQSLPAAAPTLPANPPVLAKAVPGEGNLGGEPPAAHIVTDIQTNVQDCTAETPIDKSAGTACEPHAAKGPVMAPAVFHERDGN
jgi:hypothetical protein